jgi:hypothetical protein
MKGRITAAQSSSALFDGTTAARSIEAAVLQMLQAPNYVKAASR